MNLDLFNNLVNNKKENNFIQNFTNELDEYFNKNDKNIENSTSTDVNGVTISSERNNISLIDKTLENSIVTTVCRDKIYKARNNILKECFEQTSEKGTLYYIYSKNSQKDGIYNICANGDGISEYSKEISESELPDGAGVDSVLRLVDGKYILDIESTEYVKEKMETAINELLEEQEQLLNSYRIEGHVYEVVEICNPNNVWLNDTTLQTSKCFQEINISSQVLENITRWKFDSICGWRICSIYRLIIFSII